MVTQVRSALRDQMRGITGALLVVGLTFHYTMETWWLGRPLSYVHRLGYAVVGLALIVAIDRVIGFHRGDEDQQSKPAWYVAVDFARILMQAVVASSAILLAIGLLEVGSSLDLVVRLGLIEVVPLGFGAAMADRLLWSSDEDGTAAQPRQFPIALAVFAVGTLFVASTIARPRRWNSSRSTCPGHTTSRSSR